jgi:hypothetical protein
LYDTYIYQTNHLQKYGYAKEEAFWIHFASVPFMPWSGKTRNVVPLSHLIKFYNQVYNYEIMQGKSGKSKAFIRNLLQEKFDLTYALAKQSFASELNLEFALDIATCIFPHINNISKLTLSGLVIMNAKPIYQRVERHFSFGRLVRDMDTKHHTEKVEESGYAVTV